MFTLPKANTFVTNGINLRKAFGAKLMLRLSGTSPRRFNSPINQSISKIAQARVESEVSIAVARHENALKVDGFDIYLWKRGNTGLLCTCRQAASTLQADSINTDDNFDNPFPKLGANLNNTNANVGVDNFRVIARDSIDDFIDVDNLPVEIAKDLDIYENNLDSKEGNFNALTKLEQTQTDAQLATALMEGAAIYGGDKTACGICFGTGRVQGYDLVTGKRMVLDANIEYPFVLNNANIKPDTYPAVFNVNSNGSVTWTVDLPSYTLGWLNFTVRNNLQPAQNLILEWFFNNQWQPLNLIDLNNTEGTNRTNTQIRVRNQNQDFGDITTFTHVELIYSTTIPLVGQTGPLNYMTNYEVAEPLIQTEFEIIARVDDIPRESVFQDSKFKFLWKVTEVTPKMTSQGQVFSLMLNARRIQSKEVLYALKVIFDPAVVVNYRGLEVEEGGLMETDILGDNANDTIQFTIEA